MRQQRSAWQHGMKHLQYVLSKTRSLSSSLAVFKHTLLGCACVQLWFVTQDLQKSGLDLVSLCTAALLWCPQGSFAAGSLA